VPSKSKAGCSKYLRDFVFGGYVPGFQTVQAEARAFPRVEWLVFDALDPEIDTFSRRKDLKVTSVPSFYQLYRS
jgi:hypothetical protein